MVSESKYGWLVFFNFLFCLILIGFVIGVIVITIQLKNEYGNQLPPLVPVDQKFSQKVEKYSTGSTLAIICIPLSFMIILFSSCLAGNTLTLLNQDFVNQKYKTKLKIYGILVLFFSIIVSFLIVNVVLKINEENKKENETLDNNTPFSFTTINKNENNENNMTSLKEMYELYQNGCISEEEYEKYKDAILSDTFDKLK